jgi:hypothetical protein
MLTRHLKLALFFTASLLAQVSAQAGEVTLYSREGLEGRELRVRDGVSNLVQVGFNDRAESMVIYSGRWEMCEHVDFRGDCRVFEPGEYHSLRRLGNQISSLREVGDRGRGWRDNDRRDDDHGSRMEGPGGVVLYNAPGLRGVAMPLRGDSSNLNSHRFNDQTQSILIQRGYWEFCEHADFRGQCHALGPGQYNNLNREMNRSISSVRQVSNGGRDRDRDRGRDRDRDRRDGVELFNGQGFGGERMQVRDEMRNLQEYNFNDRAGSLIVYSGQWQFCEHADFGGQCFTYGPGRYDRLGRMENQISSLRRLR